MALIYNGWSWYLRAANPQARREALTGRPQLLAAVGRAASSGDQTTLHLTPMHAEVGLSKSMIANVHAAIRHVKAAAEQLPETDHWATLLTKDLPAHRRSDRLADASTLAWQPDSCGFSDQSDVSSAFDGHRGRPARAIANTCLNRHQSRNSCSKTACVAVLGVAANARAGHWPSCPLAGAALRAPCFCFGSKCAARRSSLNVGPEPEPVVPHGAVLRWLATSSSLGSRDLQSAEHKQHQQLARGPAGMATPHARGCVRGSQGFSEDSSNGAHFRGAEPR
ncbi:hypothetical protein [Rhizobacter sp. Root16D2]|uniref:hypothetical protein n=1 Tax=Rhizobacter sp. Root16D2 TaxID=1736479 RepID=UPI0012FC5266|nr:hypothetical protein [Rhizobacter sp. Root16D2]